MLRLILWLSVIYFVWNIGKAFLRYRRSRHVDWDKGHTQDQASVEFPNIEEAKFEDITHEPDPDSPKPDRKN